MRDLLLQLASAELYRPKWSSQIQDEWCRNLLANRPDLTAAQLQRTISLMEAAFPEAEVKSSHFIPSLTLPTADDRHVVAAALRGKAHVIVTANLKDFPAPYLATLGLERQHPDVFIEQLMVQYPTQTLVAFQRQVAYLKNPPKTALEVLGSLRKSGLPANHGRPLSRAVSRIRTASCSASAVYAALIRKPVGSRKKQA